MSSEAPKILLCSGSLDGGGSERQLWQLACHLDPNQFESQIYLLHRRGVYLEKVPGRMRVHDYWSQESRTRFLPTEIHRRQVRHLSEILRRERIDIVYDRTFHMTLVTAPACRRVGVPRVSVIVSPPSRDFAQSKENFAFIKKRALRRAYCDPTARTIAVSDEVASDAERYLSIPTGKIQVASSAIDIQAVQNAAKESCDISRPAGAIVWVVVGRMTPEKGQRIAIEAFAKLVKRRPGLETYLELLGDGPDRPFLEDLAARYGLSEKIRFHGFVSNPYPWIARANALILPSNYEGLPNVVLEAMALETPVLATPSSDSLRRILSGIGHDFGKTGIQLESHGEAELSAAMERMLHSPKEEICSNALRYVHSEHDLVVWQKHMQKLFAGHAKGRQE